MVARKNKSASTRRLRFPEFIGQPLQELWLGDVTTESGIRNGDELPAASVMGVSKVDGIVPMEERTIASDIARYKVVRKDWFAYNPMRLNIGSIARWQGEADILVSPDYVVFRCLDNLAFGIEPDYLDHFRRSMSWDSFVSKGGDGSVRVRIYYKDLASLGLVLPSRAEQKRIADCLRSLDEMIAAQRQKVEALITYKRALMQELFPRGGETVPRFRFPEFRGAPEWEAHALSHHVSTLDAGVSVNSGDRPASGAEIGILKTSCVTSGTFDSTENKVVVEPEELHRVKEPVQGDTIIISRMNTIALVGANAYVERDVPNLFLPDRLWAAKSTRHCNMRFLSYVLGSTQGRAFLSSLASGSSGTMKNISQSDVLAMPILAPSFAEQLRVAACFVALDELAAAESGKLSALNTRKKGLMQQLFPSMQQAL